MSEEAFLDARKLLEKHGLRAKKHFGQNFLIADRVFRAIVDAAVAAGATDVSGPDLGVSSRTSLERQALQAAFDDAKAKAQALASRAGVTLGRAASIQEQGASPPPVVGAKLQAPDAAAVPIEPGQTETDASVTVTFVIS